MARAVEPFQIGDDVGVVGRWYRLLAGAFFLVYSVLDPILLHPIPRAELPGFFGQVGLALGVIIVLYIVVFHAIGEWVLARVTPWVGTLIFLGIPALLFIMGVLPGPVRMAWGFYISISLILTFFFRYGGCEVVSLPSMLLGHRYTMYCPLNAIDAVERAVTLDLWERGRQVATLLSFAIVTVVGGYFFLVESPSLSPLYGIIDIDNQWALLLLIPIAHLLHHAWRVPRSQGEDRFQSYVLGAGILVLALFVFLFDGLTDMLVWRGVMILGAFIAARQLARRAIRALRARRRVGGVVSAPEDGAPGA